MFLCADGRVLLNEVAPRPHNSGHYTIEACAASWSVEVLKEAGYECGELREAKCTAEQLKGVGAATKYTKKDAAVEVN